MNAEAYLALARLEAAGVTVTPLDDGNLWLRGIRRVPPELIEAARPHKAQIRALLRLRLAEPHRIADEEAL